MLTHLQQTATALATGAAGLIASGEIPVEYSIVKSIAEVGSFGLLAFAVVFLLMRGFPAWLKHMEKANEDFLTALQRERELREQSHVEFRELLTENREVLGAKLDGVKEAVLTGSQANAVLAQELAKRPCQLMK